MEYFGSIVTVAVFLDGDARTQRREKLGVMPVGPKPEWANRCIG